MTVAAKISLEPDTSLHPSPMGPTYFIRESKVSPFASPTTKSELQPLFLNESLHRMMEATSQRRSVEVRGYKKLRIGINQAGFGMTDAQSQKVNYI